jgi:A/G-specific adenine glycosylase
VKQNAREIARYHQILLEWWPEHERPFPWRERPTAYSIAIAELMLRRTRAEQVVPVYRSFVASYPDLQSAASATPAELRRLLYPLGLTWRADSIIDFLQAAHAGFGRDLPLDTEELRQLPGIGEYVGAAIACFAGGLPEPLIDTNVVRVLGRIFGLRTDGEARRPDPISARWRGRPYIQPIRRATTTHYSILRRVSATRGHRNARRALSVQKADAHT